MLPDQCPARDLHVENHETLDSKRDNLSGSYVILTAEWKARYTWYSGRIVKNGLPFLPINLGILSIRKRNIPPLLRVILKHSNIYVI